jgi:arylformamidase
MSALLDLSFPLDATTPTFPGDPKIAIAPVRQLERGDPYRLSSLKFGSHAGTHLDAPSHFLLGGVTVDQVDLDLLNGPAEVVHVPSGALEIGPGVVESLRERTRRVLFRTTNSDRWARSLDFFPDYVAVTPEAAEALLERGVGLVGVDGLSVERDPSGKFPVHHRLLGEGCWILEGLRLDRAVPGVRELRCLPLRLTGSDGSPCRAVLWG